MKYFGIYYANNTFLNEFINSKRVIYFKQLMKFFFKIINSREMILTKSKKMILFQMK